MSQTCATISQSQNLQLVGDICDAYVLTVLTRVLKHQICETSETINIL